MGDGHQPQRVALGVRPHRDDLGDHDALGHFEAMHPLDLEAGRGELLGHHLGRDVHTHELTDPSVADDHQKPPRKRTSFS